LVEEAKEATGSAVIILPTATNEPRKLIVIRLDSYTNTAVKRFRLEPFERPSRSVPCQRNFLLTSTVAHGAGVENKLLMGKLDQRAEGNENVTLFA
jgi:hypothetical protein